jgi:hypothetical protein
MLRAVRPTQCISRMRKRMNQKYGGPGVPASMNDVYTCHMDQCCGATLSICN